MRILSWLIGAVLLGAAPVRAEPAFGNPNYVRILLGGGGVPLVDGPSMGFGGEWGAHAFGGAFSTGFSWSLEGALNGRWVVTVPGLFVQLDLTYVLLSGFWNHAPPADFPFRVQVGERLGLGISSSFPPPEAEPWASPYLLMRPELHTFVDVAFPFGGDPYRLLFVRAALDSATTVVSIVPFRWSVSVGMTWGWGDT